MADHILDTYVKKLLDNRIALAELGVLSEGIDEAYLAIIIQRIYDLNEFQVLKVAALDKFLGWIDGVKNSGRNRRFLKKIKKKPRGDHKVILAEGDSWFNYPVILSDVIDWIAMEDNMAVYSLANGGDWLLNMLNQRKYVEQLSVIHPDVFLISGGGNDLVGRFRLAAMIDPSGNSREFEHSELAQMLIAKRSTVPLDRGKFDDGIRFFSKDFFALLMFFHLQYHFLMNGILCGGTGKAENSKFPGIKIITQGYDYALPSYDLKFGLNPLRIYRPFIRMFLGHGGWLKTPLRMRNINEQEQQENIIYAMIYLFNELMIYTGALFRGKPGLADQVFHVDSRGSVGKDGWADELHPLPEHFKKTAMQFINCINGTSKNQVYIVNTDQKKES